MAETRSAASAREASTRRRIASAVGDKAQQVLKEDYDKARTAAFDALKSRAYLYPIKGILYFLTHRSLWKPLISCLVPYLDLSATVVGVMLTFTYLPQLAVLVFVNGPLAAFTTVALILNEISTLVNIISRGWILQDAILDTFDGTLLARNATNMVKEGRQVKSGRDSMQRLGKILKSPFERFSPKALTRYIIFLPLNLFPVVGTAIFIFLQGRNRGRLVHGRYFQLKKWFGLVATFLEMIPLASIFFTFTNTVGAALWAADIEALETSMTDETAPTLRRASNATEYE